MYLYKYGMRLRGYSPGAQPKEGLMYVTEVMCDYGHSYYNFLYYNRMLTHKEQKDYELDFMYSFDFIEV